MAHLFPLGEPSFNSQSITLMFHRLFNPTSSLITLPIVLSLAVNTHKSRQNPHSKTKIDSTWPIFHLFASHRFRISPNWSYNEPRDIHRRYIGQRKPEYEHHHNIRRQIPNIITCIKIGCSRPNSTKEFF